MILGLRYGHSINCKGATGYIDEVNYCKNLFDVIVKKCKDKNLSIVNCSSNSSTITGELLEGCNKANKDNIDLFISLHLNSFSSSAAHGVEAWTYSEGARSNKYAINIIEGIANLGLFNRGIKFNKNFYEMKNIKAPNIILELGFCSNEQDSNILLANIDTISDIIIKNVFSLKEEGTTKKLYRVCVGSYANIENAREEAKRVGGFIHEC